MSIKFCQRGKKDFFSFESNERTLNDISEETQKTKERFDKATFTQAMQTINLVGGGQHSTVDSILASVHHCPGFESWLEFFSEKFLMLLSESGQCKKLNS